MWRLVRHHSWSPSTLPGPLLQVAMTWHCQECNKPSPLTEESCLTCGKHWTAVWKAGKKSNPRQRSQQRDRSQKAKQKKADSKEAKAPKDRQAQPRSGDAGIDDGVMVFAGKAPWAPSTPQGRQQARQVEMTQTTKLGLPPAPTPAPPPQLPTGGPGKGGLSSAESKVLSHLRGLEGLCDLPQDLKEQMQALLAKEKET